MRRLCWREERCLGEERGRERLLVIVAKMRRDAKWRDLWGGERSNLPREDRGLQGVRVRGGGRT